MTDLADIRDRRKRQAERRRRQAIENRYEPRPAVVTAMPQHDDEISETEHAVIAAVWRRKLLNDFGDVAPGTPWSFSANTSDFLMALQEIDGAVLDGNIHFLAHLHIGPAEAH